MARKDGERLTPAKRQQRKAYQDLGYAAQPSLSKFPRTVGGLEAEKADEVTDIPVDDDAAEVTDISVDDGFGQDVDPSFLKRVSDLSDPKKGYKLGPATFKSKISEIASTLESGHKKYVLWTGGFDSTALIIKHLNDRTVREIQPIYMLHSKGYVKCELEQAAQERIRSYYGQGVQGGKLLPTIIWDYVQLGDLPTFKVLHDTIDELADALGLSHQYSALRFCMAATGWDQVKNVGDNRLLEVGLVRNDEAAERIVMTQAVATSLRMESPGDSGVSRFFKGFSFPFINTLKTEIWEQSSPSDQNALRMTFSCERADQGKRSCSERKVPFVERCTPCKHRLGVLDS